MFGRRASSRSDGGYGVGSGLSGFGWRWGKRTSSVWTTLAPKADRQPMSGKTQSFQRHSAYGATERSGARLVEVGQPIDPSVLQKSQPSFWSSGPSLVLGAPIPGIQFSLNCLHLSLPFARRVKPNDLELAFPPVLGREQEATSIPIRPPEFVPDLR